MLAIADRSGANLEKPGAIVRGQACRLPWTWDGLCFGVPFHQADRAGMRDIVTGTAPSTVTEALWTIDNRGNPVLRFSEPGTSPHLEWSADPFFKRPTTALTAYVRMRRLGTPDGDGAAFSMPYDFADPWETWCIGAPVADVTKLYGEIGIGTTQYIVGNTAVIPTTQQVSVFLRWTSGTAPQLNVYGERGDTISAITGGVTGTGSLNYMAGQNLSLNCHEADTANYYGYYSQAMVWNRKLTDTEIVALVQDPFGWYAPRRETIVVASPFPIFGPGGPGSKRIGASNRT